MGKIRISSGPRRKPSAKKPAGALEAYSFRLAGNQNKEREMGKQDEICLYALASWNGTVDGWQGLHRMKNALFKTHVTYVRLI